jgi:hypothetical protein
MLISTGYMASGRMDGQLQAFAAARCAYLTGLIPLPQSQDITSLRSIHFTRHHALCPWCLYSFAQPFMNDA